jgi:predicted phosphoadenosine phosphosulfate sulfurtransferase
MSNGRWQIDEQLLQLGRGKKTTQRVREYVLMWEGRCYSNGIPDEIPELLSKTSRAPSWKKIATCLLKNDMKLRGLGFTEASYDANLVRGIERMSSDNPQGDLFT